MIEIGDVLSATTVEAVTSLLQEVMKERQVAWKPVGGRDNNLATINIGSDPAAGITERITNALDAVVERAWIEQGEPSNVRSPREAVERWFNIKGGRLDSVDARDPHIREVSDKVIVTLRDSSREDHPTVDIRDFGVGLLAEEFPTSILSLNEDIKLKKFFLAGAFGQGGSTAFSYSQYGIIVSRRIPKTGSDPHPVAFTVVRFNEGNLSIDKHGLYEYMVDHSTGYPITLDVSLSDFLAGTLVRHVHMDIGKYYRVMTAPTNSLWYLANHYLFDPVLPFRIEEARSNTSRDENRFIGGDRRRLIQGEKEGAEQGTVEYQRDALLTFRSGKIHIHWWVLSARGDTKTARDRITQYTLPSKPIILTFNGQKQGELTNSIVKNDLKMPYLERYLIVQVDCDDLDNASRRQLFSTTREKLRESTLLEDLRVAVTETLRGDDELRKLDDSRKQRYMQRSDAASTENLRRRLATRVKTFIAAGGKGANPTPPSSSSGSVGDPKPPIPVQDPPTFIEITTPSPREVHVGQAFRVLFRTDADPDYFRNPDAFMPIITPPAFGQYTGLTSVRNGYGIAYFKVSEDAQLDDQAEINLELRPSRAKTITDSLQIVVVALLEDVGEDKGRSATPNIRIEPVTREHPYYQDNGWDESSVAKVEESEDETAIYVSVENRRLSAYLERAQRQSTQAVDSVKDFYLEHISFHALLTEIGARTLAEEAAKENGGDETSDGSLEKYKEAELRRACETVCGIIEQMYTVVIESALVSEVSA